MSDTWQALTDIQALKELAGLRGIAPSVRCLEKLPQQSTKTKVYHVRQNQEIYLWGVEMFQGGYDCVEIKKINNDGTETYEKLGGKYINDFIGNDKMVYNNGLTEYAPFSDFWSEPFLIDTIDEDGSDKKIVKSNFHRCFVFPNEGFYKIILNERLNPQTGEFGFVADYNQPQYTPTSLIYCRDKSSTDSSDRAPLQRVLTDGEFRREIIIRVMGENKDIVTNTDLTTITKDLGSKKLSKSELVTGSSAPNPNTPNPSFSITDIFPNRTIFKNGIIKTNLWDTSLVFDYTSYGAPSGTRQVTYDGISQAYFLFNLQPTLDSQLSTFTNTPDLEYHPLNRLLYIGNKKSNNGEYFPSTTPRNGTSNNFANSTEITNSELKIVNMRNLIIENVTFIGSDHGADGGSFRTFFYRLQNSNQTIIANTALIDISGSILRNCTFIGMQGSFFNNPAYNRDKNFITDGCVVENCKFINTSFLTSMSCDGVLVKNCTWESPVRRASPSVISLYGGDSNCFMGNTFKCLGRSFFLDAGGPMVNTMIIRCTTMLHGNHHTAGEILTIDQPQSGSTAGTGFRYNGQDCDTKSWIVSGFMSLLNSTNSGAAGSYCLDSYFAACKLNLCAFNTSDKGSLFYLYGVNSGSGFNSFKQTEDATGRYSDSSRPCEYNVYMHNYVYRSAGQIRLFSNVNYNRILNCVFGNSEASTIAWEAYSTIGNSIFTYGYWLTISNAISGTTTSNTSTPISNLINNCVLVDHTDQMFKPKLSWDPINHNEYYGSRNENLNGFKLNIFKYRSDTGMGSPNDGEFPSGLSNTELMNKLNGVTEKENVLHNLTKISLRHS